jgi:hypothetical protein
MGYIYLQRMDRQNVYGAVNTDNALHKYIDPNTIRIPIHRSFQYRDILDSMRISSLPYQASAGVEFEEEYQNDLDPNGYMEGIELNLTKDRFFYLIKTCAFQLYTYTWHHREWTVLTLDQEHNVFYAENILYPFQAAKDAFAIVHIEPQYRTGLIKGIVSARPDLYPIDYWSKPEFVLWDESPLF